MGAADSKAANLPGVVTVSTARPSSAAGVNAANAAAPLSSTAGAAAAAHANDQLAHPSSAATAASDALLSHLLALRVLVPDVERRLALRAAAGGSGTAQAADAYGRGAAASASAAVWRDLEAAGALGADSGELAAALKELLGAYRAWHGERCATAAANQDYIGRCIDQAEQRAARALRALRQRLTSIRALNSALRDAAALPALASEAAARAAELRARCEALSARVGAAEAALAAASRARSD